MTKKEKELKLLIPLLIGKTVNIWRTTQRKINKPWISGKVVGFRSSWVEMKDGLTWGFKKFKKRFVYSRHIRWFEVTAHNDGSDEQPKVTITYDYNDGNSVSVEMVIEGGIIR